MKKIYTLLSVLALTATVSAQTNLVQNGDLEVWTNPTTPEGYVPVTSPSINNFLTQESGTIHGGSFSARHTSQTGTQSIEAPLVTVTPGQTYTISYWFLDNSPSARTRIWSSWLTQSGNTFTVLEANKDVLRNETPESYSTDNASWIKKEFTLVAPAGATHFRMQARTYQQDDTNGGFIYYDDFNMNTGTASVKDNNIAGLRIFPNPLSGSVLNVASANNDVMAVAIFDVLGKQVVNTKTSNGTVNVAGLNAGVYIVKITEAGKTATRKLVIK